MTRAPVGARRVRLLHVPGCPRLAELRAVVDEGVRRSAVPALVEEVAGPYPSPAVEIDGVDVLTGRRPVRAASCRLQLPSAEQIAARMQAPSERALFGWSPPRLPADSAAKRAVDRFLPATGWPAVGYFGAVLGLLAIAAFLPHRAGLAADALAAAGASAWCGANFWRCRHAHCLVTSGGWAVLAVFAAVEAAVIGRSVIGGNEQLLMLAVLLAGLCFEGAWQARCGTNAITRRRTKG